MIIEPAKGAKFYCHRCGKRFPMKGEPVKWDGDKEGRIYVVCEDCYEKNSVVLG